MNILVVEDEARALKRLVRLVHSILGDKVELLETATDLSEAEDLINTSSFDLLLLDLNLNGEDGFETLKSVAAEPFHTIIVSAHHDRALEAFEYGVLDFVPKPIRESRLKNALARLEGPAKKKEEGVKHLSVRHQRTIELIPVSDIHYFKGANDYTEIRLRDGKTHLYEKSLNAIELLLASDFIRIHRSFIVPVRDISAIRSSPGSRYFVELKDTTELPVGRTRIDKVRRRLVR